MGHIGRWIVLAAVVCLAASAAVGEEQLSSDYLTFSDDSLLKIEQNAITIVAENRQNMIDYCANCFKKEQSVVLCNGNYREEWKSEKDIPFGGVYLGHGSWSIKYVKNQGYMPKWRINDKSR